MVVILVDALGWELATRTPGFASGLTERRKLATILGFSSGALPTLFTGRMPCEHGRWLMYRRAGGGTPFAGFGATRWLPRRLRQGPRLGAILTRVVASRGVRGYFHLYDVPRDLLPQFDLAERDDPFAPRGLPGGALWDTLEERRIRWAGWNWRTPEREAAGALVERVARGDERFLFLYTADLDARLHREGSEGAAVRESLAGYAALVTRIEAAARAANRAAWIYLLSDHGMVDVTGTVDVLSALRGIRPRAGRDYLPFVDSTFARFWWRSETARTEVTAALAALPGGRWLDDADLAREGCLFAGREYGEGIWLCDPGRLIVPSFMGRSPLAAMHGYDPSHPGMAALLWSNRPVPDGLRHLRDVRGHLERELDALLAGAA
jgi:hypothetical protein